MWEDNNKKSEHTYFITKTNEHAESLQTCIYVCAYTPSIHFCNQHTSGNKIPV